MTSIKIAIRCRPFTSDGKLGVHMIPHEEEDSEIRLLNSKYTTTRFACSWAWWSVC